MIILHEHEKLGMPDFAVFDFDGTISKLRCGWEETMRTYMLECIPGDPREVSELAEKYIDESAGIQTILQMKWLAQQVQSRGGQVLDPWDYKAEFGERLLRSVRQREKEIEADPIAANRYIVPGTKEFLHLLKSNGVKLYLASGTDDADVRLEAAALGVLDYFDEVAGAPHMAEGCPKEATLRKLIRPNSKMLVVGDGKVEIRLGREAGAVTIGVASWDYFGDLPRTLNPLKEKRLSGVQAHALVADYRDLTEIVQWM